MAIEPSFPKLPAPWVAFIVIQSLGIGFWLSNLSSRVVTLENVGSPSAVSANNQLAVVGGKLSNIELTLPQIAMNSNRLTKLETEIDSLRREVERTETRLESLVPPYGGPSYLRGEFKAKSSSGPDDR